MADLPWHVYLLRCADGTYYCGVTTDLARRIAAHNAGTGAKYTKVRRPVTLVWSEAAPDRSAAQRREAQIKKMPRTEKVWLVEGD